MKESTLGHYRRTIKYLPDIMDDNHFIALIFTHWASRWLSSATLFTAKHRAL